MNKKCPKCNIANYPTASRCLRCESDLGAYSRAKGRTRSLAVRFAIRGVVCFCVSLIVIFGFYLSLIGSAKSLTLEEKQQVRGAIEVLKQKGFEREALLLEHFTVYRSNDNWLNASVEKENAFAATNFPFEIMTLYPDFFNDPIDATERAAILLHEARHLQGKGEPDAYEFVWKNRVRLGWTDEKYADDRVWKSVRKLTHEYVPNLFTCTSSDVDDCE